MSLQIRPHQGLTTQEKIEMREIFLLCDSDGSGALDWQELCAALRGIGFPVSKKQAKTMIRQADTAQNGVIEFDEFVGVVENLSRAEYNVKREILDTFKLFDLEKSGKLSVKTLKTLCQQLNDHIPEAELREMIALADLNGDGVVDVSEFERIILKTNLFR
eukprot:m.156109 g.156109  ORF g.156109 m.156109 type:complete len:161 (+) comp24676_c0_seq5:168-650(+)